VILSAIINHVTGKVLNRSFIKDEMYIFLFGGTPNERLSNN